MIMINIRFVRSKNLRGMNDCYNTVTVTCCNDIYILNIGFSRFRYNFHWLLRQPCGIEALWFWKCMYHTFTSIFLEHFYPVKHWLWQSIRLHFLTVLRYHFSCSLTLLRFRICGAIFVCFNLFNQWHCLFTILSLNSGIASSSLNIPGINAVAITTSSYDRIGVCLEYTSPPCTCFKRSTGGIFIPAIAFSCSWSTCILYTGCFPQSFSCSNCRGNWGYKLAPCGVLAANSAFDCVSFSWCFGSVFEKTIWSYSWSISASGSFVAIGPIPIQILTNFTFVTIVDTCRIFAILLMLCVGLVHTAILATCPVGLALMPQGVVLEVLLAALSQPLPLFATLTLSHCHMAPPWWEQRDRACMHAIVHGASADHPCWYSVLAKIPMSTCFMVGVPACCWLYHTTPCVPIQFPVLHIFHNKEGSCQLCQPSNFLIGQNCQANLPLR